MILVTGSTGLVGSHLISELVKQGRKVKALYRTNAPTQEMNGVEWINGDILDMVSLEEALLDVEQVFHCAAIVSFNPKDKNLLHKTNVDGTANVVNACLNAGIKKLLFVSSVAALGRVREGVVIDEKMSWTANSNNSEYGKTKYLAEMEVWRGIGEGLNAVMINPVIILGAGNWNKGSSEIFQTAYKEFPWYTEGISGFVDVIDVVKAMILLMDGEATNDRFIISAGDFSYREIFTTIALGFAKKPPHQLVTPRMASMVWRWEAIKAFFTSKSPLLTKETAATAQAKVHFNTAKLKIVAPDFEYTPMQDTINRICGELKLKYQL